MRPVWLLSLCLLLLGRGPSAADTSAPIPTSPRHVRPLLIGSAAPAAQLLDAEGQSFDLGEAFAAGPAILVFYRAHW